MPQAANAPRVRPWKPPLKETILTRELDTTLVDVGRNKLRETGTGPISLLKVGQALVAVLRTGLEHHVETGLGRPTNLAEPARRHHFAQTLFSGLCTECRANFLGKRGAYTAHG